jgi:serine/threonine protein kinase
LALLKNEALIMNEVYSDFIVKCYYIFNDNKNYYYVMEYMSGGDLHNFLENYSIGYEVLYNIFK